MSVVFVARISLLMSHMRRICGIQQSHLYILLSSYVRKNLIFQLAILAAFRLWFKIKVLSKFNFFKTFCWLSLNSVKSKVSLFGLLETVEVQVEVHMEVFKIKGKNLKIHPCKSDLETMKVAKRMIQMPIGYTTFRIMSHLRSVQQTTQYQSFRG